MKGLNPSLTLYRQAQGLARQGIEIGREVLAGWLGAAAYEVRPVVARRTSGGLPRTVSSMA